jgi:NADH dehydrogenase
VLPEVLPVEDEATDDDATDGHTLMQSCQYAVPLGKFAGHNVAADLLGRPLVPFAPDVYQTCLALGPLVQW